MIHEQLRSRRAVVTYKTLCDLADERGWVIAIFADERPTRLKFAAIWLDKDERRAHEPPSAWVRLDAPPISLDDAARALMQGLRTLGV